MRFVFVTLFENLISHYFEDSILFRAHQNQLVTFEFINPRNFAINKHNKVDDYAVSGGAGLVLQAQPLFDTLSEIKNTTPSAKIFAMTPAGKKFTQTDAVRLSKLDTAVFVCGRYDGIDERVLEELADELFSIGDFVLTGGELAATVICDAISRNIDGVLGNQESLEQESFENCLLEAPTFAKPAVYKNFAAPSMFLKGNHSKIADFKKSLSAMKTKFHRPDLYKKRGKQ